MLVVTWAVVAGSLLVGCGGGQPPAAPALHLSPSASPSRCAVSSNTLRVNMTVASVNGGRVDVVPVCVDGLGPYPFALDTGAAASVIGASLAQRLRLPHSPAPSEAMGVGCVTAAGQVEVGSWSLGEIPLEAQSLLISSDRWFGQGGGPDGLLGGDVLSRFGAIRIDFRADELTVLAPEGLAPAHASVLTGQSTEPPPPLLVHGTARAVAVLTVLKFSGRAVATAAAAFGNGHSYPFVIDTGAWISTVSSALAPALRLSDTGHGVPSPDVGCEGTTPTVRSGTWQVGAQTLPAQALASVALARTQSGVGGTVGLDVLAGYGSVVLDYRTALLWLGAG